MSPDFFTRRFRLYGDEVANLIETGYSGAARKAVRATFDRASEQTLPIYKMTEGTLRLSPANASPLCFPSEMSWALFPDCF